MTNPLFSLFKKVVFSLLALFLAVFSVFLFCIMPNLTRKNELRLFENYLYAHRGLFDNTSNAPENSLPAFELAIHKGYGIELDVQLTKDKVPVVIHDANLQRVASIPRNIAQMTYEEIASYKLFNSQESIPLLKDTLDLIAGQVPLMIELKVSWTYNETCKVVASLLEKYNGPYCIISFNPFALEWFKTNKPSVLRGQLATNHLKTTPKGNLIINFALTHLLTNFISRPDFISYHYEYSNNLSLNLCKSLFKVPIAVWSITSQEQYDLSKPAFNLIVFDSFLPIS